VNRRDRRAAWRLRGCWAAYTADGGPGAHAPEACDGSCHAGEVALPLPEAELTAALPRWAWMARDVMPPGPGDDADFGMSLGTLWTLTIIALTDATVARARALAPLLARLRGLDSAWARLRVVLDALGLLRSQRDHGPPALGGVVVLCHPRTGPPVAWPALEAPVICP